MKEMMLEIHNLNYDIDETENRVENLKKIRSEKVKAFAEANGKGPHDLNGAEVFVFVRGQTWYLGGRRGKKKMPLE